MKHSEVTVSNLIFCLDQTGTFPPLLVKPYGTFDSVKPQVCAERGRERRRGGVLNVIIPFKRI